jgi:hypothetical protein
MGRVGCTGISLGGMHTWFLSLADGRVKAAAPAIGVQVRLKGGRGVWPPQRGGRSPAKGSIVMRGGSIAIAGGFVANAGGGKSTRLIGHVGGSGCLTRVCV